MIWDEMDAVLVKDQYDWSTSDMDVLRRRFRECRPAVPKRLALGLWWYWRQVTPDRMPFDDREDNIALILHAAAFGAHVAPADEDDPQAAFGIDGSPDCAPLVPGVLRWGPRAVLSPSVRAAPPSPFMRAWVLVDGQGPVEILVVGEGLPEIRRDVVQAAFSASLRINGLVAARDAGFVNDMIGIGVMRISAGSVTRTVAPDLPSVLGTRGITIPQGSVTTARGALRDLVALLRRLERDTNLVRVVERPHADALRFGQTVRSLAERAAAEREKAFLRPATPGRPSALVSLLPYLRTVEEADRPGGAGISLELSPDLLGTESYLLLDQAHQRVFAGRIAMDAKLRRDRLEKEIEVLKRELESFQRADAEERRTLWDATMTLTEMFDENSGLMVRLAMPRELDTEVYFTTNVPTLIALHEKWAERMTQLVELLEAAVSRPHAPARQLAAGRFLDAVLRGATVDESPATAAAFERWEQQVAPMLRFEWRCAARRRGIDPADLFTPHTVFMTRYLPATAEDEAALSVQLYSLADEDLSAVLADSERGVLVFRDATDHAVDGSGTAAGPREAEASWAELVRLAEKETCTEEGFNALFLEALREHPAHTVRRMAGELHPPPPSPAESSIIEEELRRAVRVTSLGEGMERAQTAMRTSAFRTAVECLEDVHTEARWEARAWLMRAIVVCVAADLPLQEIPGMLGDQLPGLPPDTSRSLEEALALDADFTTRWLLALPEVGLDQGIRRLFRNLPRARANLSEREYAVWLFRSALETARLARLLDEAAEDLQEETEALDTAFVKLGPVLEGILLGPFVSARGEAQGLFEMLTGQVPPRYGQIGE